MTWIIPANQIHHISQKRKKLIDDTDHILVIVKIKMCREIYSEIFGTWKIRRTQNNLYRFSFVSFFSSVSLTLFCCYILLSISVHSFISQYFDSLFSVFSFILVCQILPFFFLSIYLSFFISFYMSFLVLPF